MKISLKKALRLRKDIESLLASFSIRTTETVSIYFKGGSEFLVDLLHKSGHRIEMDFRKYEELSSILAHIRNAIVVANATNRIDALLAEQGHIDRMIGIAKKLATINAAEDFSLAIDHIESHRKQMDRTDYLSYQASKTCDFNVLTGDKIEEYKQKIVQYRREKEAIEDKRTALNASVTIELADNFATTLKGVGLL